MSAILMQKEVRQGLIGQETINIKETQNDCCRTSNDEKVQRVYHKLRAIGIIVGLGIGVGVEVGTGLGLGVLTGVAVAATVEGEVARAEEKPKGSKGSIGIMVRLGVLAASITSVAVMINMIRETDE